MVAQWHVAVFGGLRVWSGDTFVDMGSLRHRIVLTDLAIQQPSTVSADQLIEALWGQRPPQTALNQLHRTVGELRRRLQPELGRREIGAAIEPSGAGYRLGTSVDTDLTALRRALDSIVEFQRASRQPAATAHVELDRRWTDLMRICVDEPFTDLPADTRQRPEFVAVSDRRTAVTLMALQHCAAHVGSSELLDMCESVAGSAPLNEPLHAALIAALLEAGHRARASTVFAQLRQRLEEQLGIAPSALVRAAYSKVHPAGAANDGPAVITPTTVVSAAQLPPTVRGFVDRPDLMRRLDAAMAGLGSENGFSVLTGMGGIGKTALAVRWAHSVAHRFPDGQCFVNLRGFDPRHRPLEPAEALAVLLESLGIRPTERDSTEARSAQLRARLAGRQVLLVLDNVRSSEQVRPLLPGSPTCHVVATSRVTLSGAVTRDGAQHVHMERLDDASSVSLLTARLGGPGPNLAAQAAFRTIAGACGGLPLALAMVAARVATTNDSVEGVAVELVDGSPLETLRLEEGGEDLRAEFAASLLAVSPAAARAFRRLAAHPGPDMSLGEVASLIGVDEAEALRLTRELLSANLLLETSGGCLGFHDLIAAFAHELLDASGERDTVEERFVDAIACALRACVVADRRDPVAPLGAVCDDVHPTPIASMADAISWYSGRRRTVSAAIGSACRAGRVRRAATMMLDRWLLAEFRESRSADLSVVRSLLERADSLHEPGIVADLHRYAGCLLQQLGDLAQSGRHLDQAMEIYRRVEDNGGIALVYGSRATEVLRGAEVERCVELARRALSHARLDGRPKRVVLALRTLSEVLAVTGRGDEGRTVAQEGLDLSRTHGPDSATFDLLAALSCAHLASGDPDTARAVALTALEDGGKDILPGPQLWLLQTAAEASAHIDDLDAASSLHASWSAVVGTVTSADALPQGHADSSFLHHAEERRTR